MKKVHLAAIIVSILIVALVLFSWVGYLLSIEPEIKQVENVTRNSNENFFFREEVWSYPIMGYAINTSYENITLGIATDRDKLHFGRIPLNSSSRKQVDINVAKKAGVIFYKAGNMTPYIIMPQPFILEGETKKITLRFEANDQGNYTGTFVIRNIIPKNIISEKVMEVMV